MYRQTSDRSHDNRVYETTTNADLCLAEDFQLGSITKLFRRYKNNKRLLILKYMQYQSHLVHAVANNR